MARGDSYRELKQLQKGDYMIVESKKNVDYEYNGFNSEMSHGQ